MMRTLIKISALVFLTIGINAQDLDVDGSARITEMTKDNTADSLVVRLADGTLGIRDVSSIIDQLLTVIATLQNGVVDFDGNHYSAVLVGNQVWMKENLRTRHYNNGIAIPHVVDTLAPNGWAGLSSPAYCWYNNDSATYANTYGALYNYFTVADTNSNNVCPVGWHVANQWRMGLFFQTTLQTMDSDMKEVEMT